MFKKHFLLFAIVISITLLSIAALHYPGGSQFDKNSVGYDWKNNYLSNLFSVQAVNGAVNTARPWAICGMFFLCAGFAVFFVQFSHKIPSKTSARIVRYFGAGSMVCAFLIVTPYHDIMVTIAGTGALISMFYIAVFVFTSKLLPFKILSAVCLLAFYCTNYLYYTSSFLALLPVMQKVTLLTAIIWFLCLQYFTTKADFQIKKRLRPQDAGNVSTKR